MYKRRGAYFYVVPSTGKWLPLGREYGAALGTYGGFVGNPPKVNTVHDALWSYIEFQNGKLAKTTLENYRYSAAQLDPVFGHMAMGDLKKHMIFKYLTDEGDTQANRNKALLSAAYTHASNRGDFEGIDPTKGLQFRNREEPRQRYVTDGEAKTLLESSSKKMACMARFLSMVASRQSDALRVKIEDIDFDENTGGIHITQQKTKVRQFFTWTPELLDVVNDAMKLWRRFGRIWLFESHPRGRHAGKPIGPYTPSGLRSIWRRARTKANILDVRLHDLRRKASSDMPTEAEAQDLLGHKDPKTTRRHYRAKPKRVTPSKGI